MRRNAPRATRGGMLVVALALLAALGFGEPPDGFVDVPWAEDYNLAKIAFQACPFRKPAVQENAVHRTHFSSNTT